jgi:hypothetical protein
MSRVEGKITVSKFIVDPARALYLWNAKTEESLAQIAERFCDVTAKNVRDSIEHALVSGLGDLRRPLPDKSAQWPAAPIKQPRPVTNREERLAAKTKSRAEKKAAIRAEKRRAAGITGPLAAAAEYNPQVEEILANKPAATRQSRREATRRMETLIVEWATFVKDSGHDEWIGKTIYPWIDAKRIREILLRVERHDLWEYLAQCIKTYASRRQKTILEIDGEGEITVRYTKPPTNPDRIRQKRNDAALAALRAEYESAPALAADY